MCGGKETVEAITHTKWPKPVIFTNRFCPNYLWHLLAVARIGYDSEYADAYRETVNVDDLAYLESNKSLLQFAEGEGGALSGFFTTLPAWLRLETESQFQTYFDVVAVALSKGDLTPFVDKYGSADWSDRFFSEHVKQAKWPPDRSDLIEKAVRMGQIYVDNLDAYRRKVWKDAERKLAPRTRELQNHFDERDFIADWERLLGLSFAASRYEIVLCFANKNGPDYNSLGYSGNLFYYDKPFGKTWQFVGHEIGTHLLIDTYFSLANMGKFEHKRLYAAYETLAMFYNKLVLRVDDLDYSLLQMNDDWHLKIYSDAYFQGINPLTLILKALES
jgi:hypothetical protein